VKTDFAGATKENPPREVEQLSHVRKHWPWPERMHEVAHRCSGQLGSKCSGDQRPIIPKNIGQWNYNTEADQFSADLKLELSAKVHLFSKRNNTDIFQTCQERTKCEKTNYCNKFWMIVEF
jgi:hypothetical protein